MLFFSPSLWVRDVLKIKAGIMNHAIETEAPRLCRGGFRRGTKHKREVFLAALASTLQGLFMKINPAVFDLHGNSVIQASGFCL